MSDPMGEWGRGCGVAEWGGRMGLRRGRIAAARGVLVGYFVVKERRMSEVDGQFDPCSQQPCHQRHASNGISSVRVSGVGCYGQRGVAASRLGWFNSRSLRLAPQASGCRCFAARMQ